MNILRQLNTIFQETFLDPELEINQDTSSNDVDGWDSFTHLNLLLALEQHFQIRISDEEAPQLKRVASIMEAVQRKQKESMCC